MAYRQGVYECTTVVQVSYNKAKEMHKFLKFIFGIEL
jgi:hypothetical protein